MAINKIYVTGKTLDDAIKNGLKELNAELTDISFKTINEGGLFSKTKIEMWLDEVEEDESEEATASKLDTCPKTNQNQEPMPITNGEADKVHKTIKINIDDEDMQTVKTCAKNDTIAPKTADNEKIDRTETIKNFSPAPKLTNEEIENIVLNAKTFLESLVKFSDSNATVTQKETDNEINFDIEGESLGNIIGNGGETLDSIQLLINVIATKNRGFHKRIYIDAGKYKSSKDKEIVELALAMAEKVKESGESIKLKPLTAYQRRVVHATLADSEDVITKSIGEEPNRNIFILPKSRI